MLKAMEELDYHANVIARSLQGYGSKIIAIVTPDMSSDFFRSVIKGVETVFYESDYYLLMASTNGDAKKEESLLSMLVERRVDALVLESASTHADMINHCIEHGIITVLIDRLVPGAKAPCITSDNNGATQQLIRLLLDAKHQKIGIINVSLTNSAGISRFEGYKEALRNAGIALRDEYISGPNFTVEDGRASIQRMLDLQTPPTALFCANNKMTEAALSVFMERRLEVGRDISLVSFGTFSVNRYLSSAITVAQDNGMLMGQQAGECLMRRISGKGATMESIVLDVEIIKGKSICRIS